jgi:hypothetical protein
MAELLRALDALGEDLVAPRWLRGRGGSAGEVGGLDDVLPGVFGALGALGADNGAADAAAADRLGLPATERVCVVLVDGLGWHNLAERAGHAPFCRARLAEAPGPLVTSYPSTTAAALATFGTACPPGRTGMLGYTVLDPDTDRLVNLVSWDAAVDPRRWQREPTVLERGVAAGVRVTAVGPSRFADSGLTTSALRGPRYVGAERLGDRVDVAVRTLRRPGLVYLYWGDVDKTGHHQGAASPAWGHALEEVDAELGRLARSLPAGTLVLVTADHGMVDVDRAARWDVGTDPVLRDGVRLVGGEPRALHVYAEPGVEAEALAARWSAHLGDAALVATRSAAVDAGLFGDVADHVLPRIGDVVVATTGRATVVDSRTQTPASLELVGVHGSLTPTEMLVPLLTLVV